MIAVPPKVAKDWLDNGVIDQEAFEALTTKPKNKYSAQKTEVDGIVFDSKAESRRYAQLAILAKANEISELKTQVKYSLDIDGVHICNYVADFEYFENGLKVTEDCKGMKTPVYRLKKKLMLAIYKIEIKETR